jgi:hypothetical protein
MLDRIVDELLKKETLEREAFEAIFAKPVKQPQAVAA